MDLHCRLPEDLQTQRSQLVEHNEMLGILSYYSYLLSEKLVD
jgi:hypothetical protein